MVKRSLYVKAGGRFKADSSLVTWVDRQENVTHSGKHANPNTINMLLWQTSECPGHTANLAKSSSQGVPAHVKAGLELSSQGVLAHVTA